MLLLLRKTQNKEVSLAYGQEWVSSPPPQETDSSFSLSFWYCLYQTFLFRQVFLQT